MNAERKQRKDKLELKILHSTFHDMAREHGAYARTHSKCGGPQQQTEDHLLLWPEDGGLKYTGRITRGGRTGAHSAGTNHT